jgi:hypothetical protein
MTNFLKNLRTEEIGIATCVSATRSHKRQRKLKKEARKLSQKFPRESQKRGQITNETYAMSQEGTEEVLHQWAAVAQKAVKASKVPL